MADVPVVFRGEEDIRSLIRREIERRGTLRVEDMFRENWEIVPSGLLERPLMEDARGGR